MQTSTLLPAILGGSASWPPSPREALPPFPQPTETQPDGPYASCWTHDAYETALPFAPPSRPDIDFHRGNVMGVRCPGLPQVAGNSADPAFIVTWFEYLYARLGASRQMLGAHVAAGYTHMDLHRAAWMGRMADEGVPGCSRQEALDSVRRVAARIPYPIVNLAIDDGAPDPAELKPWIDDLIAAGMKIGCLAWQIDQRIPVPVDLCDYIDWAAPYLRARGCKVSTHWVLHGCAVYDDATCAKYGVCDRFSFQRFCADRGVNYVYEQFDVNAPLLDTRPHEGGIIGEAVDMLKSLAGDMQLVIAEYDMQAEFNHPAERLERYGDLKGRSLLTARWAGRTISGFLNGDREPNGTVT